MAIDAETYRQAAIEHVTAGRELYEAERYALVHYLAGLAVECILRAYRARIDPEFDSRHDLDRLHKLAKFADIVPQQRVESMTAAMEVIVTQWSNDLRFYSEEALRRRLVKLKLFHGIKGDFVKERTRRILNAASEIVAIGAAQWKT